MIKKNEKNNGNFNHNGNGSQVTDRSPADIIASNISAFPLEVLHFPLKVRVRDYDHYESRFLHKNIHWAINSGGPLYVLGTGM